MKPLALASNRSVFTELLNVARSLAIAVGLPPQVTDNIISIGILLLNNTKIVLYLALKTHIQRKAFTTHFILLSHVSALTVSTLS